jgi:hypothetical protein
MFTQSFQHYKVTNKIIFFDDFTNFLVFQTKYLIKVNFFLPFFDSIMPSLAT